MILGELKRILTPKMWMLIGLFLFLQPILLISIEARKSINVSPISYRQVWKDVDRDASLDELLQFYSQQNEQSLLEGDYFRGLVYRRICDELQQNLQYSEYVKGVIGSQVLYTIPALASQMDAYSKIRSAKIAKLYKRMQNVKVEEDPSLGVDCFAESQVTDYLVFFLLIVFLLNIWRVERENGFILLVRSCSKGRIGLVRARILIEAILSLGIVVVFYGSAWLTYSYQYGMGSLNRSLASVYSFGETACPITVGQYLLFTLLLKWIAFFIILLIGSSIMLHARSTVQGTFLMVGIFACSYLLFEKISVNSGWMVLRSILPYSLLRTEEIFQIMLYVPIFGQPISLSAVYLVVGFAYVIGGTVFLLTSQNSVDNARSSKLLRFNGSKYFKKITITLNRHLGRFAFEIKRFLIKSYGWVLLIILVSVTYLSQKDISLRYDDQETYYYATYLHHYQGEITDAKIQQVEKELEAVQAERIQSELDGNLQDNLRAKEGALAHINSRMHDSRKKGVNQIFYDGSLRELLAIDSNRRDVETSLYLIFCLGIVGILLYGFDTQSRFDVLQRSTRHGKRIIQYKRFQYYLIVIVAVAATIVPVLDRLVRLYHVGYSVLNYPLATCEGFSNCNPAISIWQYLLILFLTRVVVLVVLGEGIRFVSTKLRSVVNEMILFLIIAVLPYGLMLLSEKLLPLLAPYTPMLGNYFWKILL